MDGLNRSTWRFKIRTRPRKARVVVTKTTTTRASSSTFCHPWMTSRYGSRVEAFQIGKSNVCFENELFVRASENSNILVMLSINAHDWKARPKAIGSGKIWKTRIGECNAVAGSWITKKKKHDLFVQSLCHCSRLAGYMKIQSHGYKDKLYQRISGKFHWILLFVPVPKWMNDK